MRNTAESSRGGWATFAKAARVSAPGGRGMSQSELARQLKVDRVTVWRWENGQQKPESVEVVVRFAEVLAVDLDEALAAAGLLAGATAPAEPTREVDPEIAEIQRSDLPEPAKRALIEHVVQRKAREEQQRLEDIRQQIRMMGGRAS